jgi:hypothetical protein
VRIRDTERAGLTGYGGGTLQPRQGAWGTFATASLLLVAAWAAIGLISGGAAWIPWFLLVIIPWWVALARRGPGRP